MIFFNNAKFLLLFVFFTGGFQQIQSFWCCNDDTTVDTRLKPSKSNFSLKEAIDQNKKNYKRIISSQVLNQKNASNQSSITSSNNRSDLATAMINHEQNKKKSSQDNSLNSQTSVVQFNRTASPDDVPTTAQQISASTDQTYTDTYLFKSSDQTIITHDKSNDQSFSLGIITTNPFSSQDNCSQNGNSIALGEKSCSINSHMSELWLSPRENQYEKRGHNTTQNNFLPTHSDVSNHTINDEFQNNNLGFSPKNEPLSENSKLIEVIQPQTAKGQRSPNHPFRGRISSSQNLPLFFISLKESTDSLNNTLPNAIPESFNQNNDN